MRRRGRNEPTEVILKSGKKVRRVLHHGDYRTYIIHNGYYKTVRWCAGHYYEVYD
jgi:hypothetical protein